MSGFNTNIFVNLPKSLEKHLICSICLNIYNNAIRTQCEHTFCKSCVQIWIQSNHKDCPECRTGFTSRKRTTRMTTDLNLVIICEFIFKNNLTANDIINELKVKCDYHSNGCHEEIELGILSTHLLECEHRLCKTCGFTVGGDVEHNCLELMKTDRNQMNEKILLLEKEIKKLKNNNNKSNQKINELKAENLCLSSQTESTKKLKNLINDLVHNYQLVYTFDVPIYFGTYINNNYKMRMNLSEQFLFNNNPDLFVVKFESIDVLKYCSERSFSVLIIKPNFKCCKQIRKHIGLTQPSKGWFDVRSQDPKERYIIMDFRPKCITPDTTMALIFFAFRMNPDLKCQSIDANEAKLITERVLKSKNNK